MPKYENGIIYKLKHYLDYDDLNIYIGSTCNFKHRKNGHKTCCNNENHQNYSSKVYEYIRNNGGWDDWVMIPIEQYSCNSKKELEIRERHHIDLLRPTLNKQIPTRTFKEYYENNKEIIKQQRKEFYEDNKEKKLEKQREFYEKNKEKIAEKHKEYNEANKVKLLEQAREYYENNKEQIKKKTICDHCGSEITKKYLKKHKTSQKCINFKNITPLVDE